LSLVELTPIRRMAPLLRKELVNQQLDRTVRRTPGNQCVALRDVLGPQVKKVLSRLNLVPAGVRRRRARDFEDDLRLLNDVLAATDFGKRYWVWGGMLLGWAREGRLISHDIGDADFGYDAEDEGLLAAAEPALLAAGFRRWFSFWSNSGVRTEHIFIRRGNLYEFFRMESTEDGMRQYHLYGASDDRLVEAVAKVPDHGLEPFEFLGRTWQKPVDHEEWFTLNYGDWRTPDADWNYLRDDGAVIERTEWRPVGDGGVSAR
jgi:hypothetical protein